MICLTDDRIGLDPAIDVLPLGDEPFDERVRAAQQKPGMRNGKLRKVAMFRPGLVPDLDGPLLALDIDVVITGGLDAVFDHAPGTVCMPAPFSAEAWRYTRGQGSVIRFDPAIHGFLYERIASDPEGAVAASIGSEQAYTSGTAHLHGLLTHFPPAWIVAFKRHCRRPFPLNLIWEPKLPPEARIVCFQGRPKIEQAVQGYGRGLLSRSRPAPWIAKHRI